MHAGFGLTLVAAAEPGYLALRFCARAEERWSEDAPRHGPGSSLRKWVFASKVSLAHALVLPQL